ncbi:SPASM domain-containing protein [Novosphingobium rosa]|uniref:SPASM domain-containing protein n=1 Tax=Novosphingobium rosa TaxID=76978 RepID=UPI000836D6CF|nr:SPASM domain-containing protein [Novosphingobium rosa]
MVDATHRGFDNASPVQAPSPLEGLDADCMAMLDLLVQNLADGVDHPEVWTLLGDLRRDPALPLLLETLQAARPMINHWRTGQSLDIVAGVLTALIEDKAAGLALLKAIEVRHAACPQLAGACFFVSRIDDAHRTADLSARFCEAPFVKFETLIDGTVAPCCSIWTQHRLGHLDRQSFEEIWNSPDAQAMRESILDGSFRYCHKQRCTLIMEDSLPLRDEVQDITLRQIIDEHRTELSTAPQWLFLAHDPTCNLACPSCRAGLEIASPAQQARFDIIMDKVLRPLLDSGDNLKVSISGQGDPWSSQHYRDILRHIADNDLSIKLQINTNALLMGEKRWADYAGLERHDPDVIVSIDAATPWVYEHVRKPGKWPKLIENLRFIADRHAAGVFPLYALNATIQLDNYHDIPALVALSEALGADELQLYMIQNTGAHLGHSFARANIADAAHPLHLSFLETLRNPCLDRPVVHMYDVANWRAKALEQHLPSDDLGDDWDREQALEAIRASVRSDDYVRAAALCAAVRQRFPADADLLLAEGAILDELGFTRQGDWRRAMATAAQDAARGRKIDRIAC